MSIDNLLGRYYPGSKQLRRPAGEAHHEPVAPNWDDRSYTKKLYGKEIELFTIGALAKALGKAEGTIRAYQDKGYLPKTPYRLPTRIVNGEKRLGRRLFTRQMIEAAVESFAKRGLVEAKRVEWKFYPDLPLEIADKWKSIQDSISNNAN